MKKLRSPYATLKTNKLVGSRKARGSKEAALVQVALDEGLRPQRELMALGHTLAAQTLDVFDRLVGAATTIGHRALALEERRVDAEAKRHADITSNERARVQAVSRAEIVKDLGAMVADAIQRSTPAAPAPTPAAPAPIFAEDDLADPDDAPTPRRRGTY